VLPFKGQLLECFLGVVEIVLIDLTGQLVDQLRIENLSQPAGNSFEISYCGRVVIIQKTMQIG